ncbi:TPA: LysR family transcriptional regulator [Serratia marcescens]
MVSSSQFCHGGNMNQRLSIDALRALLCVIDTGSMTRAAQQLNLSQSAVSWKIKRLEAQLGRTLLDRQGVALAVTADGEVLAEHGRRILSAHDRALAHFAPSALQGAVRLGATEQTPLPPLAALLAAFSDRHPQVDVQLVIGQSQSLRRGLAQGELDLILHQRLDGPHDEAETLLGRERLHWCSSPGWHYRQGESIKLVSYGPDCFYRSLAERLLSTAGIGCKITLECPSVTGMLTAIAAGMGVGVLNQRCLDRRVRIDRTLERLLPLPTVVNALRIGEGPRRSLAQTLGSEIAAALQTDTAS